MKKPAFEYQLWFLLMLIATVLSAFIIPNPWLRAAGVAVFAILCHLFGVKEGELVTKSAAEKTKAYAEASVAQANVVAGQVKQATLDNQDEANDTFVKKP